MIKHKYLNEKLELKKLKYEKETLLNAQIAINEKLVLINKKLKEVESGEWLINSKLNELEKKEQIKKEQNENIEREKKNYNFINKN